MKNIINKTVSHQSYKLMSGLIGLNKEFFTITDAQNILSQSSIGSVRELIRSMIRRGLVMRIKEGLFHLIPFEREVYEYFPNWHLTAKALAQERQYYLGFSTALDIHGLLTQPTYKEQIIVQKRIQPEEFKINNIKFEFITYNTNHFFGYENTWINNYDKVHCSNLEKTIIDCLYKPQYAMGISEIVKAIYATKEKIDQSKMVQYLERFMSQAVLKRLGFILYHLDILFLLRKFIESNITSVYAPLDPSMLKSGKHHSKWRILDNVGIEEALNALTT